MNNTQVLPSSCSKEPSGAGSSRPRSNDSYNKTSSKEKCPAPCEPKWDILEGSGGWGKESQKRLFKLCLEG